MTEPSAERIDAPIDRMVGECIAVRARILSRAISGLFDGALRPIGLKVSQMNILVAAAKMGVASPGVVCDRLHLDPSTLSRNVERMRSRGWLEVVPGSDARLQPFRLTAAGRRLLERAAPVWEGAQRKAAEILGAGGTAMLARVVDRFPRTRE